MLRRKETSGFIFSLALLASSTSIALAQSYHPLTGGPSKFSQSLRTHTTYGLFDTDGDDWLKLVDRPQELSRVKGFQLHSLLSNLTTGNDKFASGTSSDNRFATALIGNPSILPRLTLGFAAARGGSSSDWLYGPGSDNRWGNAGIDDNGDGFVDNYPENGYGDDVLGEIGVVSETMTNEEGWDTDSDGVDEFHSLDVVKADADGRSDFGDINFILAGGWRLSDRFSVGLSLLRDSYKTELIVTEIYSLTPSSANPVMIEPIGWDDTERSTESDVTTENSGVDNQIAVGTRFNLTLPLTVDAKITINRYNQTNNWNSAKKDITDYNPNEVGPDAANNNLTRTINASSIEEVSGTQIGLWSKIDFTRDEKTRLLGFFEFRILPGKFESSYNWDNNETNNNPDREMDHHETMTSLYTISQQSSGDISGTYLGLAGHLLLSFEPNVLFGIGAGLRRASQSRETTGDYSTVINNDWAANLSGSYTTVDGYYEGSSRTVVTYNTKDAEKITTTTLYMPVAAEVSILEELTARIGAQYAFTSMTSEDSDFQIAPYTNKYTRKYDDPNIEDITQTTVDKDDEKSVRSTRSKVSVTKYRFGFGWRVNENVNIDFAGTAKLTDLSDWRLALTIML